jgi:hypothetical protein
MKQLHLIKSPEDTFHDLLDNALDVTGGPALEELEVIYDQRGRRLWVNINGVCILRVCRLNPELVQFSMEEDQ